MQKQPQRLLESPEFVDTDSDTEDEEEQGPAVKQPQKVSKSPEFVDTDSDTEDKEEQEPEVKKAPKSPGLVETRRGLRELRYGGYPKGLGFSY